MEKKGFTIIEVLTVVIILAILATLAVPPFIRTMDAAKGRLAKTNLKLIYAAEKVYRNEVGGFMPYGGGTAADVDFNKYLGLDIKGPGKEKDFVYSIVSEGLDRFRATATYQGARYPGAKINIDQEGNITTENWPLP